MSGKKQWGLHGYAINDYKEQLEAALTHVPADNTRGRSHIQRVIGECEGFLKAEGLSGDNLIDKESQDVVEKWIRGLLQAHPASGDAPRRGRRPALGVVEEGERAVAEAGVVEDPALPRVRRGPSPAPPRWCLTVEWGTAGHFEAPAAPRAISS